MPGWQEFYERHKGEDFELITVAMDIQGAEKAQPWLKKAGATYPALVDRKNLLGGKFGFNFVPLTLLFDEQGNMVRGPNSFNGRDQKDYAEISRWLREGKDGLTNGAQPPAGGGFANKESELRFKFAVGHLQNGNVTVALTQLKRALKQNPDNWLIIKQIWALENPDRFYDGEVDYSWQREQLRRMK